MVQEVGAASEAQDGVGQLQGEVSRLAQLAGCRGGDKKSGSVRRICGGALQHGCPAGQLQLTLFTAVKRIRLEVS